MLVVVKTLCASLQMGLEQLADVNRPMGQHHNTLWDVHLRQTVCDVQHLSKAAKESPLIYFFFWGGLWTFHCGN